MEALAEELEKLGSGLGMSRLNLYRHLINGYAEVGDMFKAKETLDRLKANGLVPDARMRISLLYFYINVGFYNEARQLANEIKGHGAWDWRFKAWIWCSNWLSPQE